MKYIMVHPDMWEELKQERKAMLAKINYGEVMPSIQGLINMIAAACSMKADRFALYHDGSDDTFIYDQNDVFGSGLARKIWISRADEYNSVGAYSEHMDPVSLDKVAQIVVPSDTEATLIDLLSAALIVVEAK